MTKFISRFIEHFVNSECNLVGDWFLSPIWDIRFKQYQNKCHKFYPSRYNISSRFFRVAFVFEYSAFMSCYYIFSTWCFYIQIMHKWNGKQRRFNPPTSVEILPGNPEHTVRRLINEREKTTSNVAKAKGFSL